MATKIYTYDEPIGGSNGGTTIMYHTNSLGNGANEGSTAILEEHYFWGQPYNGQQDVNGDITINKGNVVSDCGDLHMKGINTDEWELGGNITADNHTKTRTLEVEEDAEIGNDLIVINNANIGNNLNAKYATIEERLEAKEIGAFKGEFENIEAQDIKTHNLTVTGLAHFFELTIDKISASGGAVIYSPADGFVTELWSKIRRFYGGPYNCNIEMPYMCDITDRYIYQTKVSKVNNYYTDATEFTNYTKYRLFKCKSEYSDKEYYLVDFGHNVFKFMNLDDIYGLYSEYFNYIEYDCRYTKSSRIVDEVKYNCTTYRIDDKQSFEFLTEGKNTIRYPVLFDEPLFLGYDNEIELPSEMIGNYEILDGKVYSMQIRIPDIEGNYDLYRYEYSYGYRSEKYDSEIKYILLRKLDTYDIIAWDYQNNLKNFTDGSSFYVDNNSQLFIENNLIKLFKNCWLMWDVWEIGKYNNYEYKVLPAQRYFDCGIKVQRVKLTGFYQNYVDDEVVGYKLLWRADDGHKAIRNMWQVNDQAICRNFNEAQVGTTQNAKNKYYWSLVTDKGLLEDFSISKVKSAQYGSDDLVNYHPEMYGYDLENPIKWNYICLSATDLDGELDVEVGDEISMLGNRLSPDRQGAIYMSAYSSLDFGITPPFIAQYEGINDYTLDGKRTTWFAKNGNRILGDLVIEATNKSVQDTLDEKIQYTNERLNIKILPANPLTKTYDDWIDNIGKTVEFTTSTTNITDFIPGAENDGSYHHEVKEGVRVMVENIATHKYSYSTKEYSEDTKSAITVYGQIVGYTTNNKNFNVVWQVKVEHILDGDLQNVWTSMAQIRVTQDGISLKVQDLDKGIAELQLKADSIETKVSNLETDMSTKFTQTSESFEFAINELNKLLINDQNIVLNENTIVNGNVTVPSPYAIDLVDDNGITHLQSKSIGSLDRFYEEKESVKTYKFNGTGFIPDCTNNSLYVSAEYSDEFYLDIPYKDYVFYIQNLSCTNLNLTTPNNNLSYGSRGFQNTYKLYSYAKNNNGEWKLTYWNDDVNNHYLTLQANKINGIRWGSEPQTIKFVISQVITMKYFDGNGDGKPDNKYAGGAKVSGTTQFTIRQPIKEGEVPKPNSILGTDGFAADFGNGGVIWLGKDQTSLNYKQYELCIKDEGIFKRIPDITVNPSDRTKYNSNKLIRLKDVHVDSVTGDNYIDERHELVIIGNNKRYALPSAPKFGTRILVTGGIQNVGVSFYQNGHNIEFDIPAGRFKEFIFIQGGWIYA